MAKIPERFTWAASCMNLQPPDKVLEIGCGAGLFAEVIALQLTTGCITAVDQSKAMLDKAIRRNRRFIEKGTAEFLHGNFAAIKPGKAIYDKIAAFNVNFFWKDAAKEMALLKKLLRPGGTLFVFYQAPYEITLKAATPVKEILQKHGFTVLQTELKKLLPTSAFVIAAQ